MSCSLFFHFILGFYCLFLYYCISVDSKVHHRRNGHTQTRFYALVTLTLADDLDIRIRHDLKTVICTPLAYLQVNALSL